MRILSAAFALLLAAGAAHAAETAAKRPISHEDVWLMKRVGTPALSPDGRWVVVPVASPAYDEAQKSSDLWLVPADGSAPPRQLTSTAGGESGPAWSPDSRRLAFAAKREGDEEAQIYVLDVAGGGEARRVTGVATGAGRPLWRPDGEAILFTSMVWPGAADDEANRAVIAGRKARKYNARAYEDFPIRHWDRWLDERRPTLMLQPLEDGAKARDLLAGTTLVQGRGFGGDLDNDGESLPAAWSPDGSAIVFAATTARDQAARAIVQQSLFVIPAGGGEPRRLTGDEASYASPQFAPDGSALYARQTPRTRRVYNDERLVRFDWADPSPRAVAFDFHRPVDAFQVAPGGERIFLLAGDEGHDRLFSVAAAGGEVRELGRLEAGNFGAPAVGGTEEAPVLVANWGSAVSPAEVHRVDPASGARTALTAFNAERVATIDWQPVREFWFTSKRGRRIHSMIALPPGFDPSRKYPLFVLIHGGPHLMYKDEFFIRWNYHLLAQPGYVVLMTNYSGSTGFGEEFAQAIQGDPLEGPAAEINQAADEAIRRYPFIDATRQAAGGASYGGHLANWLAVSTDRYRALVSHAGLYDLKTQWTTSDIAFSRERNLGGPPWEDLPVWRRQSPFWHSRKLRTPILVTFGERDFRVPYNNGLEFWTVLKRQQVESRLVIFPDENHWILKGENSRYFYEEVQGWLARHLAAP
ncbi:MAG TPA: S9 family peptidase [Steroidobacteraceae bacterium]|jgi:dipeptidyl aminopeptidase/acylaminoacyl peptidase